MPIIWKSRNEGYFVDKKPIENPNEEKEEIKDKKLEEGEYEKLPSSEIKLPSSGII